MLHDKGILKNLAGLVALATVFASHPARAACPALTTAVVPYTTFSSTGAATVITQPTTQASAVVQGSIAYDTAANALKVCGGTAWQTLTTGTASQWSDGRDGAIYYSGGYVGIGKSQPSVPLDITSADTITYARVDNAVAGGGAAFWAHASGANADAFMLLRTDNSGTPHYWNLGADSSDGTKFKIGQSTTVGGGTQAFTIDAAGNVGIGTAAPGYALDVAGGANFAGVVKLSGGQMFLNEGGGNIATGPDIRLDANGLISAGSSLYINIDDQNMGTGALLIGKGSRTTTGVTPLVKVSNNGNVGIGTSVPVATLDVHGYAKLKNNTAAPVTCGATYEGSIALTSATRMCVCDGSSWKEVNSATACTW